MAKEKSLWERVKSAAMTGVAIAGGLGVAASNVGCNETIAGRTYTFGAPYGQTPRSAWLFDPRIPTNLILCHGWVDRNGNDVIDLGEVDIGQTQWRVGEIQEFYGLNRGPPGNAKVVMAITEYLGEEREHMREIVLSEGYLGTGGYAYGKTGERGLPQFYNDKSLIAEPTIIFSVDGRVLGRQKMRVLPKE